MHRQFTLIVLTVAILFLSSCRQPTKEELIVGKWKFDHIDRNTLNKGRQLSDEENGQLLLAETMFKGMSMEFFSDKSVELQFPYNLLGGKVRGTYNFGSDGKYLTTVYKANGEQKADQQEIIVLNSERLKLKNDRGLCLVYKKE